MSEVIDFLIATLIWIVCVGVGAWLGFAAGLLMAARDMTTGIVTIPVGVGRGCGLVGAWCASMFVLPWLGY